MTDSKEHEDDDRGELTTNFNADTSGTGHFIAAFHLNDRHARMYGPCVAVYPTVLPARSNRIIVTVPKPPGEVPQVVEGDTSHFEAPQLDRIFEYVTLSREILILHWKGEEYASSDLLRDLKPAG